MYQLPPTKSTLVRLLVFTHSRKKKISVFTTTNHRSINNTNSYSSITEVEIGMGFRFSPILIRLFLFFFVKLFFNFGFSNLDRH